LEPSVPGADARIGIGGPREGLWGLVLPGDGPVDSSLSIGASDAAER
jgi:hypothetical protein